MTVSAPPRPPAPARMAPEGKTLERKEIEALVEALIEEARREHRRRHRKYWALAALATCVGAVILILFDRGAASQTASPALSARSGAAGGTPSSKIAFLRGAPAYRSAGEYQLELDVVNVDGGGRRRLARGPWSRDDQGFYAAPDWSPDGRKFVFAKRVARSGAPCRPAGRCNDEIYVINADGTGLRRLTRNAVPDGHPVWSPDGRRIAFLRRRAGPAWNIYVMNADGSGQRKLTQTPRRQGEPAWSPDGEKIAFSAPAGHLGAADVFVINADGSGVQNVTNTTTTSFDLAWSPDGEKIAYIEIQIPEPRSALYVVNADGTGKQRVTRPLAVDVGIPSSWSPDGRTLAFTGVGGIYTVHADGSGLRRLTGHSYGPTWSPDGRKIAFISDRDDRAHHASDIFVMNADGSGQRNLTDTPNVSEHTASWAPG
jgi:Tol biopolymer transport system component